MPAIVLSLENLLVSSMDEVPDGLFLERCASSFFFFFLKIAFLTRNAMRCSGQYVLSDVFFRRAQQQQNRFECFKEQVLSKSAQTAVLKKDNAERVDHHE